MKKILASLALAGVMATAASAQTFGPNAPSGQPLTGTFTGGSYTVTIDPITVTPNSGTNPGPYTYSYTATLSALSGAPAGFAVNQFSLNLPQVGGTQSFIAGSGFVSGSGFSSLLTQETTGSLTFNAPTGNGLAAVGNSATFGFRSNLPPTGTIGIVASTANSNAANVGHQYVGPGAVIPEPGSLALMGLGLLPLALVARRRAGRSA